MIEKINPNLFNIAIFAGGYSSERQISLNTAGQIYSELCTKKYNVFMVHVNLDGLFLMLNDEALKVDINDMSVNINGNKINFNYVVIALHGSPGEDGKIQGLLDILNIPYSASGVFTSALTFDKIATKKILSNSDVHMAKMYVARKKVPVDKDYIQKKIGFPCFIKPNTAGSSYGVSKVYNRTQIEQAVKLAFKEDDTVIVEEFIEGIEVSCGVLKTKNKTYVFPITEIDTINDYFDTEAKYTPGVTDEITPARVPENHAKAVQIKALQIYEELNCKGITRVDFIIKHGLPYFLELNTIPGMSAESIVPKQLKTVGLSIGEIFDIIIQNDLNN